MTARLEPQLSRLHAVPAPRRAATAQETLTVTDIATLSRGIDKIETKLDQVHEHIVKLAIDSRGYDLRIAALVDDVREERAARERAEARIVALEQWRWYIAGAIALAAVVLGVVMSLRR